MTYPCTPDNGGTAMKITEIVDIIKNNVLNPSKIRIPSTNSLLNLLNKTRIQIKNSVPNPLNKTRINNLLL